MGARDRIRNYFSSVLSGEISDEDDIFELGVANSLFAMQLVLFVEREFSITVEREDLDIKHFCSIAALTNLVQAKLASTVRT